MRAHENEQLALNPSPLSMSQLELYKVVKSNQFVQARYDWSVPMHRIIMMLVAQINMDDDDFTTQRISVKEIARLSGSSAKSIYDDAADAAEQLLKQSIEVRKPNGEYHGYNLLSDTHYIPGSGYIEACFNPKMKPFLLHLKERFTQYLLRETMPLSSPYSIRLYELIKMREGVGYIDLTIEELRSMFMLEDKYPRFRDLRRRVIDQARDELREKCDLCFDYKVRRNGRSPVAIKFIIQKNKKAPPPKQSQQKAPQRAVVAADEERADACTEWFDKLDAEERRRWWKRATDRAARQHPDVQGKTLESMTWIALRQLWRDEVVAAAVGS